MKSKIKAALLHFLLSIMIVVSCASFMLLHFYPSVFLGIENPFDALKILVPADIILGPLLTFFIYKKDKWGLKFDLIVIITCQLIALGYGCHAIYAARPGFLVLHGDAFYIVPPKIDQTSLSGSKLAVGRFDSPKVVYLLLPGNSRQRLDLAMESTGAGVPIHWQAKYYKDFKEIDREKLTKAAIDPTKLKKKSNAKQAMMLDSIKETGKENILIPVIGSYTDKVIVVNQATKTLERTLDISAF